MYFLGNKLLKICISILFCVFLIDICLATESNRAEEYYKKGMLLYEQGKYKEAEQEFQNAITASERAKNQHYQKGLLYYEQGKYKQAEIEFKQAIQATKEENDQHYKRGLILYNQGRYKEAEEEFQKAISTVKKETEEEVIKERKPAPPGKTAKYIIGNGDLLIIKIWQNPDLDDEVIVRPDGMISFPLVGDITAAGMTISDFKEELTNRLKEFIKYPQVSVSIRNIAGEKVIVLGEVKNPGIYLVTGKKTILEAVSLAGGFTDHAVVSSVMLIKGGFEKPKPIRLNLTKALKRADISDNRVMESEDMIYVPRKFIRDINYFLSQFLNPLYQGLFINRELEDL